MAGFAAAATYCTERLWTKCIDVLGDVHSDDTICSFLPLTSFSPALGGCWGALGRILPVAQPNSFQWSIAFVVS